MYTREDRGDEVTLPASVSSVTGAWSSFWGKDVGLAECSEVLKTPPLGWERQLTREM